MKKLFLLTLIICICTVNIHGSDDQNPENVGFRIEGLNEAMADAASKAIESAITNGANRLQKDIIPAVNEAVENNAKKFKSELVQASSSILLSTAGLMITSAGIMLMYQGLKADSEQENNTEKKVNTTKLFGYGSGLIVIGVATMMHMSIRNVFSSAKV